MVFDSTRSKDFSEVGESGVGESDDVCGEENENPTQRGWEKYSTPSAESFRDAVITPSHAVYANKLFHSIGGAYYACMHAHYACMHIMHA